MFASAEVPLAEARKFGARSCPVDEYARRSVCTRAVQTEPRRSTSGRSHSARMVARWLKEPTVRPMPSVPTSVVRKPPSTRWRGATS